MMIYHRENMPLLKNWLLLLLLLLPLPSMGSDTENIYKVDLGTHVFSLSAPKPPVKQFVYHQPKIAMEDAERLDQYGGIEALRLSWIFSKAGILRKDEGAFELKTFVRAATFHNVETIEDLREQVLARYRRTGLTDKDVLFDQADINGRKWLIYKVFAKSIHAYATGVSADRYVVVQLLFIDNTSESSPTWQNKAYQLAADVLASLRIE